jgi:regulator of cell morphogenesis and NO signaling
MLHLFGFFAWEQLGMGCIFLETCIVEMEGKRTMNEMPFHCGHMMGGDVPLCPALQQFKQEHVTLREQMEQLFQLAEAAREHPIDWPGLKEKAIRFEQELTAHSEREEEFLFTLMAQYIGRETGPIAVMEYEHQQGKKNLQTFIEKLNQADASVHIEKAKEITAFMIEAYHVLSQHFMKEENVLFPMAERLLSSEEKDFLAKKLKLA